MVNTTFHRSWRKEDDLRRETLMGIQSGDERGRNVMNNMDAIMKHRAAIAEQQASATPNTKVILKYTRTITDFKNIIKNNLKLLGADYNCLNEVDKYIDDGDVDNIHYTLLKLLAKRNPGMFFKKYTEFGRYMAEKQRG